MKLIHPQLYIGSEEDWENQRNQEGWSFLLAAKTWHAEALRYPPNRGAPKESPEYLYLVRKDPTRFIMNLVDAPDPGLFRPELIDWALLFITQQRIAGKNVLVCCNEGRSRAPSIGMLWLVKEGKFSPTASAETIMDSFRYLYPSYEPGTGIKAFVESNWSHFLPPRAEPA